MARQADIEARLRELGFAIDWSVTGPDRDANYPGWYGTIDPIGRMSICGECRGHVCFGETKAEFLADCLEEAAHLSRLLEPCADPDCEFHEDDPR